MDAKNVKDARQRLLDLQRSLVQGIKRNRLDVDELAVETTEDEYDLATISQNRDLLYDLHESDYARLKSIEEALKALDSGQYGECVSCGDEIMKKRLVAVPWATLCLQCQEDAEKAKLAPRLVMAGNLDPEIEG